MVLAWSGKGPLVGCKTANFFLYPHVAEREGVRVLQGPFYEGSNIRYLTCLLRNLYADQETTLRTGHGTTDWFKIGKGVCQGYILSPCLFNLYAEYIM